MAKVSNCPGFESFGSDIQQVRKALNMSRRELASQAGITPRYLAAIELSGTIPSVPVMARLIHVCKLSAETYFYPNYIYVNSEANSEQRQRTNKKLQLCPEQYLPIVEGILDGISKSETSQSS